MEFRSISFLFRGLSPTPLLVAVYYYLLHILTGTFFYSVFLLEICPATRWYFTKRQVVTVSRKENKCLA